MARQQVCKWNCCLRGDEYFCLQIPFVHVTHKLAADTAWREYSESVFRITPHSHNLRYLKLTSSNHRCNRTSFCT